MEAKTDESRRSWPDAALVVLLLLLAAGLHAWLVTHTVVAARDSIGFIRFALWLDHKPLVQVLREADQHPGYPVAVWLVSKPVRALWGTTPETMVLSAQLASALAGTLLVIPMFYLGRLLFDRRAGFWAAVLFQCLPVSAHVIGDAISEAVFFLFLATCLLLAAQGLRDRSAWRLALCGLFGGLAYLTRPEGALAVLATLVVLLGIQFVRSSRWSWRQTLAGTTALLLAAGAVGGPYMATIGSFTAKPTAKHITIEKQQGHYSSTPQQANGQILAPTSGPLFASMLGMYIYPDIYGEHETIVWQGLGGVLLMTGRAFQYVLWLPALLGLWWFRDRLRTSPGTWVLLVLCLMHALILWRMAAIVGYVSERHALTLLLAGCFWAAAMLGTLVAHLIRRPALSVATMAVLTGFALPSTLKPMHANRLGHREAGKWIAAHAGPDDVIVDPYAWAHFYAGGLFNEDQMNTHAFHKVWWIVKEHSDTNNHPRLDIPKWIQTLTDQAAPVYTWTPRANERKDRAEMVEVLRIPPLP